MSSPFTKLKRVNEQFFDHFVIDVRVCGRLTLQVSVNLFEHDKVILDFIPNSSQLLLFLHDPLDEHSLPVVSEHLAQDFRRVFFPLSEDSFTFHQVCLESVHVPWVMVLWDIFLSKLSQHLVNEKIWSGVFRR